MSERRLISTGSPFEKAYGYSRAVIDGDLVFVAGTTGYDYTRMIMPDDVVEQTRNCWKTIGRVLHQAGSDIGRIGRFVVYVTDIADCEKVLATCGEILADIRPAGTFLVVSALLKPEMKVEIEVTARC